MAEKNSASNSLPWWLELLGPHLWCGSLAQTGSCFSAPRLALSAQRGAAGS